MITVPLKADEGVEGCVRSEYQVGDLALAAMHAESAVTRAMTAALAPTGLVVNAFTVLQSFVQGAVTAGEVARMRGLSDRVVWTAVQHLEQRRCILRTGAPRSWGRRVSVTYRGVDLYRQAGALIDDAEQRLLHRLGEPTGAPTIDLLRRLATATDTHPGGG